MDNITAEVIIAIDVCLNSRLRWFMLLKGVSESGKVSVTHIQSFITMNSNLFGSRIRSSYTVSVIVKYISNTIV